MKTPVRLLSSLVLLVLVTSLQPTHAQRTPWERRLRKGVVLNDAARRQPLEVAGSLDAQELRRLGLRPRGAGLIDLSIWPEEPASPGTVSAEELANAMRDLCPASSHDDVGRYAEHIVRYSRQFEVDPWLVAALVYTQSGCREDVESSYGTGLTLINAGMHARHVRRGVYRYGVRDKGGWQRRALDVSKFAFHPRALSNAESNLYFAAAFVRVFREQCPDVDRAFDSSPHRHSISHFVWGDKVSDTGPEDRILTARRRLLRSHAATRQRNRTLAGIDFVSPLRGFPRIATSGLGEPRDGGRRSHRGIDFASEAGEPVLAVASGVVTFAGVDWERRAHIALEPWGALLVHRRHMGPKGLFVEVDHGDGVVSLYAHLARYDVNVGDEVLAGEVLGLVGETGVRDSGPHLHLGLFRNGRVLDPLKHLAAYVFPPHLTHRGQASLEPRAKRRRARRRYR
ncbi:MAG: M23 family metallopeptidase [Myxococcota bacterium]